MVERCVRDAEVVGSNPVASVMRILGFQKLTLLDYPGKVACTIFIGGCNFCCPFCHNAELVINPNEQPEISKDKIFSTLKKRQGILEGVCVTGGEPTLFPELKEFLKKIKELGYAIKLDTNGYRPEELIALVEAGLVDYVAMDIKNSSTKYTETVGLDEMEVAKIQKSIEFLKRDTVDYEFRTTVVKELHTPADMEEIGRLLNGARQYFIQSYREADQVISTIFSSYDKTELEKMRDIVKPYVKHVELRGV